VKLEPNWSEKMIESLPIVSLVIDIALSCTIFYLAVRVGRGRGPSAAKLQALEALEESLSRLLKEASGANGELQRALQQEQKKLEELLFDIETVEQRLNKGFDDARSAYRSLKKILEHSAGIEKRLQTLHQSSERSVDSPAPNTTQDRSRSSLSAQVESIEYDRAHQPRHRQGVTQKRTSKVNTQPMASSSRRPLRERITKESVVPGQRTHLPSAQQSLEDIYATCEELLRAGQSMQEVAARVNLSIDEVERLQSLMILEEGAPEIPSENSSAHEASAIKSHPTLGALSQRRTQETNPIARSRQVIS